MKNGHNKRSGSSWRGKAGSRRPRPAQAERRVVNPEDAGSTPVPDSIPDGIDGRHCGERAQYTGMAQIAAGHDVYTVGFLCRGCGHRWGERMSYNRAMVMREEQS